MAEPSFACIHTHVTLTPTTATTLTFFGDVIVVTIHYRLAIFGSMHTGDDRIKGGNHITMTLKFS